tara:strand:+ start:192 stop:2486 length:2295 start_codon:yes stop_codon:yes gene_type:complete
LIISKIFRNINLTSWKSIFFQIILISIFLFFLIFNYLNQLSQNLPTLTQLDKFNPEEATNIYSAEKILIKQIYSKKREMVNISDIPKHLIDALLVMEDREFYEHHGLNIKATVRALGINLISMSKKQGASTITQQLARNMYADAKRDSTYIGSDKTIDRKLKEFITALKIEQVYSKSKILELYLNTVFYGHNYYGIQAASKNYFGKNVSDLTLDESAVIVGLLPAPNRYSPFYNPQKSQKRKELVLYTMYKNNLINEVQYVNALEKPLPKRNNDAMNISQNSYFTEHVRRELETIIDENPDINVDIYKDGLKINTTLDYSIQKILTNVFNEVMIENQKKFNNSLLGNDCSWHKKVTDQIDCTQKMTLRRQQLAKKYNITTDSLKSLLEEDVVLENKYKKQLLVQGSAIVIDNKNGHILAMIGGRTERDYQDHFNRATQAARQPGSVFKPFIYLSALENGITACQRLMNIPVTVFLDDIKTWDPQNWDGETGGTKNLREGLLQSANLISVRIVKELISPSKVKSTAERFDFTTPIRAFESISLGVSEVKLIDIVSAYSAIANNGVLVKPISITSIFDNENHEIKQFYPDFKEVANENDIFILRDIMKDVIRSDVGTGRSIRTKYDFNYNNLGLAGKTGTTNDKTNAWFIGFTPQITIGIWVGMDDPSISLGNFQYGSSAALPIFAKAISKIYDLGQFSYNNSQIILDIDDDWNLPNKVKAEEICKDECCLKTDYCESYKEYFVEPYYPKEDCSSIQTNPMYRNQD